jgi:hypothetical protein
MMVPVGRSQRAVELGASQQQTLTRAHLKTPRAAAIAGIVFSVLMIGTLLVFQQSVPADQLESGAWLATSAKTVAILMNLVPFTGIAFLWFIGVLRDRLGSLEDRFFATVFFGSGLLFLAMLFASAAAIGAIVLAFASDPQMIDSVSFHFARAFAYNLANVYAIKTAGVFMISASTMALYTGFAPRWIAFLGYALALILLLGSYYIRWSLVVLPLWVLLVSLYILIDNWRSKPANDRIASSS